MLSIHTFVAVLKVDRSFHLCPQTFTSKTSLRCFHTLGSCVNIYCLHIVTGVEHVVVWRMEMGMIPRLSCYLGNEVEMKQLYIAAECLH